MAFKPTEQQNAIIEAFGTGDNLTIEAGAGTGKTATLRLLSESTNRRGIYFAYNKAIANEAKISFPRNVACSTAHSLAYRAVGHAYKLRLGNGQRISSKVMAVKLGISEALELPESAKIIPSAQLARLAAETVKRFCYSADFKISGAHVPFVAGIQPGDVTTLREAVTGYALDIWEDVQLTDRNGGGQFKFEHDHYLKIWALTSPKLSADFILLDEAQDANPVIASIVMAQEAQCVLVGDSSQAIYGWRGAVNAMRDFDGTRFYLSQSFRFGPAIADEANKWLMALDADLRLSGFGQIDSRLDSLEGADAILCRSNAGAVGEVMQQLAMGLRPALVGTGDQIKRLAQAAQDLQETGQTDHPELFAFTSWEEVRQYTIEDDGGSDLKVFVKLIDSYGVSEVIDALNRLVSEQSADVVISTAHKAKGREWKSVRVSSDFQAPDDNHTPSREEMMLNYVTVTRAQEVLNRGSLDYVDSMVLKEEVR